MKYSFVRIDNGLEYVVCNATGAKIKYNTKPEKDNLTIDQFEDFLEWNRYSRKLRKKLRKEFFMKTYNLDLTLTGITGETGYISFEPLPTVKEATKEKEKEMSVFYNTTNTPEKDYLLCRVRKIFDDKLNAAESFYHMYNDPTPHTPKELVDRIKAGLYVIPEGADEFDGNPLYTIEWRDPNAKKDTEGYKKYKEMLKLLRTKAQDTIVVKSLDEGLAAVQEFENTPVQ